MCLSQDVGDSIGFWAGPPELQLLREPGSRPGQAGARAVGQVLARGAALPCAGTWLTQQPQGGLVRAMAWPREREASMSVLERLLANAALRDEAGRLRSPEPHACPPSGSGVSQGKLGGGEGAFCPYFPGLAEGGVFLGKAVQRGRRPECSLVLEELWVVSLVYKVNLSQFPFIDSVPPPPSPIFRPVLQAGFLLADSQVLLKGCKHDHRTVQLRVHVCQAV